jgi:bifunctional DNase/RNase
MAMMPPNRPAVPPPPALLLDHAPMKRDNTNAVGWHVPPPVPSSEDLTVPAQMELRRIISSSTDNTEQHVIILKEVEGERSFPIVIGLFEETSIERRVKNLRSPRPLTHDLLLNVIEGMGGELRDVYISDLRDGTYYARLRIQQGGELVEIDSRPSDAIAMAVTARVPIFVAEEVINEAASEIDT